MNTAYASPRDWRTLAAVAILHAVTAFALLSVEPVARAVGLERPLLVSLIEPAPPAPLQPPPPPRPEPPKPVVQKPVPLPPAPQPVLAATPVVPEPVMEAAPAPVPEPVRQPEPGPTSPPVVSAPPAPVQTVQAAPPPPPVVAPRFDADYLHNPAPRYPPLSRRLGEEGRVLLRVLVEPEGSASRVEVKESSGSDRLDRAAKETVVRWRFVPAKQGNKPVSAWVVVPIAFNLRS